MRKSSSWFSRTRKSKADLPPERKPLALRNPYHAEADEPPSSVSEQRQNGPENNHGMTVQTT